MNERTVAPTLVVIFGITGDLSRRKLLPALWQLFRAGALPEQFRIIGFARRALDAQALRALVRDALGGNVGSADDVALAHFLDLFSYQQGRFDELAQYRALGERLTETERAFGAPANRLFYLAVAPAHYEALFEALEKSGLARAEGARATRILVEKPFGRDARTAQALDDKLAALFGEEQIYRIDHYLAKETVQNILNFRFSNFIFESLWSKEGIEKVHIELLETIGIEGRGEFYGDTGALRDVGQNHVLQLLAMVAMQNPGQFDAAHIRAARAAALRTLRPIEDLARQAVRGQYEGFVDEPGVAKGSQAETYFKLRAFLDDDAWEGVPFILESGKRLAERATRITIYFKNATRALCSIDEGNGCQNTLTFEVQPEEGITVGFWAKKPGFSQELERRALHFSYARGAERRAPEAYERVLYDAIRGDQTLFASTEEVHASWHFITPILDAWHALPLEPYAPGSRGPESRNSL
ncbi:MAG TPA: glucose-6-phosphate dehydrogenase [Candidatus Paceibacterota bacterium]